MSRSSIHIHTIGFTKKTAKEFFERLHQAKVRRVIDIRLHNSSQLAGFTKRDDLEYFLHQILGIDYIYLPILTPTQELMDAYKKRRGDWSVFERQFLKLMRDREIEKHLDPAVLNGGCLLCSEEKPHHCHRRLVAEYLSEKWGDAVKVDHL